MDKTKQRTDLLAAGRKKLQQFRKKKDHKGGSSHAKSSSKASKPDVDGGEADEQAMVPEANSAIEMETGDPLDSLVEAQPVYLSAVSSFREASGGVMEEEMDPEEPQTDVGDSRSAIALPSGAMQEANFSGTEQCNINGLGVGISMMEDKSDDVAPSADGMMEDHAMIPSSGLEEAPMVEGSSAPTEENHRGEMGFSMEIGRDESTGSTFGVALNADRMVEDHAMIPSSGLEVASEVDGPSAPSKESHGGEMGFSVEIARDDSTGSTVDVALSTDGMEEDRAMIPSSGLEVALEVDESFAPTKESHEGEMGFSVDGNGGDVNHVALENNGVNEETDLEGNGLSVPDEAIQEAVVNLSNEPEESASQNEHFEMLSSTQDVTIESEYVGELQNGGSISLEEKDERVKEEYSLFLVDSFADGLESLRMHLYLTNVAKDFVQLQLADQIELNAELQWNSSAEVSKLLGLVKETQESKVMFSEELTQCRSELQATDIQKGELEKRCLSTEEEINKLHTNACELQDKLELSQVEFSHLSAELADCKGSLEALQMENMKLIEEKEFLSNANMEFASELSAQKERLITALDTQTQLEGKLRETEACYDEFTEENLSLSSSLVVHEAKIKELDRGYYGLPLQARETGHPINSSIFEATATEYGVEDSGSSAALGVLKGNLEEAKSLLENLEKSIQEMHSHSVSLKSGGRAAAPGISKLIQAFESKTHLVDNVSDEVPSTEGGRSDDSYTLASQQVCNLKGIVMQMDLDVGKVEVFLKEDQNNRKLSEQIKMDCETRMQQTIIFQANINDLDEKLSSFKSRIDDLQGYSIDIHQSANDEAGAILSQVELLQKEVNDRVSILEQENDSIRGMIFEAIEKLNASTGLLISGNVDIGSLVSSSVDAATVAIKSFHEKLEAAHQNYSMLSTSFKELNELFSDIKGKKELAIELLNKYYFSLRELANDSCENEAEVVVNSEEVLQFLPEKCEKLIGCLLGLLDERLWLLSTNNKLESELLTRNQDVEQLNMTCNSLANKLEDLGHAKDGLESVLIDKSKDIEEFNSRCLSLAKKLEEHDSCQKKLHFLSISNFELENEVNNLKEGLSKMEEALESSRSELQLKASELEQSEQRLSSVREKLSIAVVKGKGLIVQRDSLKQSLMDKSGELEKCTKELLSKEALLHELEAKLKSCSGVERVEALESELSYIRNSATALRDSFLLKDSVLQRIEEVLEVLDLPEHFHSKDIVDKIELLARSVAGNTSVTITESDSGFVATDAWNDDSPPNSNPEFDELRRKYEELQNKLYGLAEHSDMLEQSLLERNDRVQKWEEVLNGIDMPPLLRTLEPEDRIEWLIRMLSEVQQERDSLQLKIENLEDSSDMLIVDLEESHRKISELTAEVVAVKSEKEFFSGSLDELRHEYLELSDKAVQDELDRENLQRKLFKDFQNKGHCDIEKEIQRLYDLIVNALPDNERFDSLPGGSDIECLEELLTKLINYYTTLYTEESMHKDSEKELVQTGFENVSDEKEQDLIALRFELDEAFCNLVIVKEERDAAVEKLMLEIETVSNQRNSLQEERTKEEEKYHCLVLELEAMVKQRDALQEQLTQEEQRSASAREKLNVAVRKGKVVVQQRESLKKTIEEMNQRVQALESEKSLLANQLADTEQNLHDTSQKMEGIGKLCDDLRSEVVFSENKEKKSKRAAELLLAELNEVQERADILQEELAKSEAAKIDTHSRLEQVMSVHSEEKKKQLDGLIQFKHGIDQLREGCFGFSSLLSNVFTKDVDNLCYLEANMESILKQTNGANVAELPVLASNSLLSSKVMNEGSYLPFGADSAHKAHEHLIDGSLTDHFALVSCSLHECVREYDSVKENIHKHSYIIDQQATRLLKIMEAVQRNLTSRKEFLESLQRDVVGFELMIKEKGTEVFSMRRNISLLYEACSNSILEIENVLGKSDRVVKFPGYVDENYNAGHSFPITDDRVRTMADTLSSTVKDLSGINEVAEAGRRKLKASVEELERELQEKDTQTNRICAELVSQIRDTEDAAKRSTMDLNSARAQLAMIENDKKSLESRVNELQEGESSLKELQKRSESLTDALSAKDQEIEALMQALDEEESQMEVLENRNKELENIVQEKIAALENLEASRSKAVAKVSTTMIKFDELHSLSESLLAEIENLQSQLQDQDSEISFLRQEVTRCTDDFLASQETNKKCSSEMHELQKWMDMMASLYGVPHVSLGDEDSSKIHACTDIIEKKLNDLRMKAESKDALLQIERGKLEELLCKAEVLETSLHEKETQIELLKGRENSVQPGSINSPGTSEIEQIENKVSLGPIKTHVRGGRKVNNDQIAIAIDTEKDGNVLEDEDDDKAHGFKSLTMSRIVPRAIRPITDRIDGIWVSGERLLMRQPTLRLGLLLYWVALHVLLASAI